MSKKLRIDPTTIYYWIRDNRRPHEMAETLKELGSSESQFYADDFPVGIPHADVVAVAKPRRGRTKKKKARRG